MSPQNVINGEMPQPDADIDEESSELPLAALEQSESSKDDMNGEGEAAQHCAADTSIIADAKSLSSPCGDNETDAKTTESDQLNTDSCPNQLADDIGDATDASIDLIVENWLLELDPHVESAEPQEASNDDWPSPQADAKVTPLGELPIDQKRVTEQHNEEDDPMRSDETPTKKKSVLRRSGSFPPVQKKTRGDDSALVLTKKQTDNVQLISHVESAEPQDVSKEDLPAPEADAKIMPLAEPPTIQKTATKQRRVEDDPMRNDETRAKKKSLRIRRHGGSTLPVRKKSKVDDTALGVTKKAQANMELVFHVESAEPQDVSKEDLPAPQADAEVTPLGEPPTDQKPTTEHRYEEDDPMRNDETPTKEKSGLRRSGSPRPVQKKARVEDSARELTRRERQKERERKKKERRLKLDLAKFWRQVKKNPSDFTAWSYLLECVDMHSDPTVARKAFDEFLYRFPYCFGFWRRYAEYEHRQGKTDNCIAVYERGVQAVALSVDLWVHYIAYVEDNTDDNEELMRSLFERAVNACGLEFRSDKLWDAYIRWESKKQEFKRIVRIYDRLLAIPTQGYKGHFKSFRDVIIEHDITTTMDEEEIKELRTVLQQADSSSWALEESDKENKSPTLEELPDEQKLSDPSTLNEHEIIEIKVNAISKRRKLHRATADAVEARRHFEDRIKRPYFHVEDLGESQLQNWRLYLNFEIEMGDQKRILFLFERCLIACAIYDEFWLKLIGYLDSIKECPGIVALTSDVFQRACLTHVPDNKRLQLMWADFEESQDNFNSAAQTLTNLEAICPNVSEIALRRINLERRRGKLSKCRELYEHYIQTAKNETTATNFTIKYARFLHKICLDLDGGMAVLRQTLAKYPGSSRVALQLIDLAMQRSKVDEDEVVRIFDEFMASEHVELREKIKFATRKVAFLEDFGSTAKGLKDAEKVVLAMSTTEVDEKRLQDCETSRGEGQSSPDEYSPTAVYNATIYGDEYHDFESEGGSVPQDPYNQYYNHYYHQYYIQYYNQYYNQYNYEYYDQEQGAYFDWSAYNEWLGYDWGEGNYYN